MILLILLWIVIITAFSLFGSWYARKYDKADALIGLYVAFVLISNLIAFKIAEFNFGFVTFYATAGVLVFSVTFLMTDIVNEKFGRKETHKMIFIAFLTQVAVTLFIYLAISLPSAPFWNGQDAFNAIFGFVPRVILASWISFLVSENFDAYLYAMFKKFTKGKHLWMRNAFSSIPAMALDSILFVTIAFYGLQPLLPLITGVLVLKWLVGIVDIPFMYLNRWVMYRK
jgi:uncharacterized integral membrane protein (TIGR00697 family)